MGRVNTVLGTVSAPPCPVPSRASSAWRAGGAVMRLFCDFCLTCFLACLPAVWRAGGLGAAGGPRPGGRPAEAGPRQGRVSWMDLLIVWLSC